jgi:hypothetical protein
MAVLSTADSLLVAVPMIGTLVVCFFRLDELVGKPRKPRKQAARGHQLSGLNADGSQAKVGVLSSGRLITLVS